MTRIALANFHFFHSRQKARETRSKWCDNLIVVVWWKFEENLDDKIQFSSFPRVKNGGNALNFFGECARTYSSIWLKKVSAGNLHKKIENGFRIHEGGESLSCASKPAEILLWLTLALNVQFSVFSESN